MKLSKKSFLIILVALVLVTAITLTVILLTKDKDTVETNVLISFETYGGEDVPPVSVLYGSALENIPTTRKDGSFFMGWFTDEAKTIKYNAGDTFVADTTLYALFIAKDDDDYASESTEAYLNDANKTALVVIVSSENITTANLSEFVDIENMTGALPPLTVTQDNEIYSIAPREPYYTDGGLYRFTLRKAGTSFHNNPASVRQLTIRIHKDPVANVECSDKGYKYIDVSNTDGIINGNQLLIPTSLVEDKVLNVGDTICIGTGAEMDLQQSDTLFINIESIERLGENSLLQVCDSSLADVVGDVDVYFENNISITDQFPEEALDEIEGMLYASDGTKEMTYLLAAALGASPTIKQMGDGTPLYDDGNTTFSEGAKILSGVKITYDGLIEGLTINVRIGDAQNNNFDNPDPDNWAVMDIEFHYETTLKNKVKLDATLRVSEYLNVTMQGGKKGYGKNIDYDYAVNLYTQTDMIFTVLVCSVDDEDSVFDEIIEEKDDRTEEEKKLEDISIEISLIMSGDEEMDTDNIVKKMQELLDTDGDYIELCRVPIVTGLSYPVIPQVPVFSVNMYLDFVIKVNFAAGISTKLSVLDAKQIGIRGNTGDFTVHSYSNTLPGANRFSFDLYACGYLGIKAGLAASLTISFNGLASYGELGAEIQLGAYFDIYGYVHVHVAKPYSESTFLEKSIQGGLYCEVGLYMEVNLIARSKVFRVDESLGVIDLKLPIFGIGDKYVLLEQNSVSSKLFLNKNSIHISQIPILTGTFLDITTGDTVNRPLDTSKLYLTFESRYMKFDRNTGFITVDPSKIGMYKSGPYGDGLDIGDRTFETKMHVYFAGQTMDFGATYDALGLTQLGVVDVTWVDESLKMTEANLGQLYTATLVLDCDGVKTELFQVTVEAGKSLGILPTWSVYELYAEDGGWDVNPNQTAIGRDTTFTYKVAKKQALVGFLYFDGNTDKWVSEIHAVNYNEAPIPPAGSENSYAGKMSFNGWNGTRGINANKNAIANNFSEMVTIPSSILAVGAKTDIYGYDTTVPVQKVVGSYSEAKNLLVGDYSYKMACSYEASYTRAKCTVTIMRPDDDNTYQPYELLMNYESTLESLSFDTIGNKYEIIGWSDTDDGTKDYDSPKDFPLVRGAQTYYYAIYKHKECSIITVDAFGETTEHTGLVYTSVTEEIFDSIKHPEVPDGESWEFDCFEFSRDKEKWWQTDNIYNPSIVFQTIYIRPVFKKSYLVTIESGDGSFSGETQSFSGYYLGDIHVNPLSIAGQARKEQSDEYTYEHVGWIDTLHDNAEFSLRDAKVTTSMRLVPLYETTQRLYELNIYCPQELNSVQLNAKVYGTETDSLKLSNLSYSALNEKKDYYSTHFPAAVTIDDKVYTFATPTISKDGNVMTLRYSCTQAYAEHILTFDAGDGVFENDVQTIDSDPYILRTGFYFNTFRPVPVKASSLSEDFVFTGWETPDGVYYPKDGYYNGVSDITLTAVYAASDRIYTITFTTPLGSYMVDGGKLTIVLEGTYNEAVNADDIPEYPVYVCEDFTKKFTCTGWDAAVPTSFVTNTTLAAVWKEEPNTFLVTYMLDGEVYAEEELVYGTTLVEKAPPSATELAGKSFSGWSWLGDQMPATMPLRNLFVYGRTHVHYVIYVINDDESYRVRTDVGSTVTPDAKPTESGYTFTDWEISGAVLSDGSFVMPSANVTFSSVKSINSYAVSYELDGETYGESSTFDFNTSVSLLNSPIPKKGYTFSGWKTDNAEISEGQFTMPGQDVLITGSYTINSYNLVYYVNGSEKYREEKEYNEAVLIKAPEVTEGLEEFSGWQTVDAAVVEGEFLMPANDVSIYGFISAGEYVISYYMDSQLIASVNAAADTEQQVITPIVQPGYAFQSWMSEDVVIESNAFIMPQNNISVNGTSAPIEYTLRYLDSENGITLDSQQVAYGSSVLMNDTEYVQRGRVSSGWHHVGGDAVISDNSFVMPNGDVTFVAKWTPYFTIDNGETFEKYDAQAELGFTYDDLENLVIITDSGLTLSGKTNCLIYVDTYDVILRDLEIETTADGYYYTKYSQGDCDGCMNCEYDASLIVNAINDPTITIQGVVTIKKLGSDSAYSAAISVLYPHFADMELWERGMVEDRTITFVGNDNATLNLHSNGYGIKSISRLNISNLIMSVNAFECGIVGTGIELNELTLTMTGTAGNMSIMALPSTTSNDFDLIITDCDLMLKGTLSATGSITINGNTRGKVQAESRAALDISSYAEFNTTGQITFSTIAPEANSSCVLLNREESEIVLKEGNSYISPVEVSKVQPKDNEPIWYLASTENDSIVYVATIVIGTVSNP